MPADYQFPVYVLSRPRYYDGQFLRDQDFIDDQKHHIDARRRHERLLHVAGILEGLDVTAHSSGKGIDVAPGSAVDDQGRQILLAQPQSITALPATDGTFVVSLAFSEIPTDKADLNSPIQDYTRFTQTPTPVSVQAVLPAGALPLAEITVMGGQITNVDSSKRAYSGLRLPSAGGAGIGLAASGDAAPGWAALGGSLSVKGALSVNGNVGVGVAAPAAKLDVGGDVRVAGNASVVGTVEAAAGGFKFPDATIQTTAAFSPLIGSVHAFAGSVPPAGYLVCDGSAVSRVTYARLFAVIGSSWGGNGVDNFNLPDLRGRFLRGVDMGAARDPEAAGRGACNPGGNVGDQVGSVQGDSFRAHDHGTVQMIGDNNIDGVDSATTHSGEHHNEDRRTTTDGGSETRPINAYVLWLIFAGIPAS